MIAKSSLLFRQTKNKQTPNSVYDTITSLLVQKKILFNLGVLLSTNGMSVVVNVCLLGYILSVCISLSFLFVSFPTSLSVHHVSLRTQAFPLTSQLFYR